MGDFAVFHRNERFKNVFINLNIFLFVNPTSGGPT